MAQAWQLDRLRVLGAKADPPEPQPGDTVSFSSFIYAPSDTQLDAVIWFACLAESASSFGCTIDPSLLEEFADPPEDPAELAQLFAQLQEAGFAGVEPDFPPQWKVPDDALDMLSDAEKIEGRSAFVSINAAPSLDPAAEETERSAELAYRRLVVSLNPEPNQNPVIDDISVDGISYAVNDLFTVLPGQEVELSPGLTEESVESYTYIGNDGEEQRSEQPFFNWYTEGGNFRQPFTLYPNSTATWTAPSTLGEGIIATVVRDRRGGMAWAQIRYEVTQ